jgi:hypothetical protein
MPPKVLPNSTKDGLQNYIKVFIFILLLVAIIFLVYKFFYKNNTPSPTPSPTPVPTPDASPVQKIILGSNLEPNYKPITVDNNCFKNDDYCKDNYNNDPAMCMNYILGHIDVNQVDKSGINIGKGQKDQFCLMCNMLKETNPDCADKINDIQMQYNCGQSSPIINNITSTCPELGNRDCLNMENATGDDRKFINNCYVNEANSRNHGDYFRKKNNVNPVQGCIDDCEQGNFNLPACKSLCESSCKNFVTQGPK